MRPLWLQRTPTPNQPIHRQNQPSCTTEAR
jgi:hypothetical protein